MSPHRSVIGLLALGALGLSTHPAWSADAAVAAVAPPAVATPPAMATPTASVAGRAGPQVVPRFRGLALSLGVRTDLVRSRAFDPFSERDALPQSSLSARYLYTPELGLGFGLGVAWDHGSTTATARAASTALKFDRLSVTLEGRAPLSSHFTALARVAPGLLRRSTTLTDVSLPNAPYTTASVGMANQIATSLSADASVGIEWLVGRAQTATLPVVGLSLLADAGYSYSPEREVVFASPSPVVGARSDDPVRFGKLALGGVFFRFAASVLF